MTRRLLLITLVATLCVACSVTRSTATSASTAAMASHHRADSIAGTSATAPTVPPGQLGYQCSGSFLILGSDSHWAPIAAFHCFLCT